MTDLNDLWDRADALDDEGAGDIAADLRHVLSQYDSSRRTCGHTPESCGCKLNRILWNVEGEDIDEIVIHEPEMVHIEQMSDRCWWIGIYVGDDKRWSGNFWCDSRGLMGFAPQDDDVEFGEDRTHAPRSATQDEPGKEDA